MNKQKKELRQRQSTRQLMGISQLTQHGIRTSEGELVFYLIKPDNLSVLSEDGIRGRVMALTRLLCTMSQVQMLALDSRESFRRNKDWYRLRMEQEDLPAIRELLRQDSVHLDDIQAGTASAREFAIVLCPGAAAVSRMRTICARPRNASGIWAFRSGWQIPRTSSACWLCTTSRM